MEEKNPTISNIGKRKLVKNKRNLTNQKSNKKKEKTSEAWWACWSFKMGLRQIHKREFKMKSTFTTKKRRWLLQI
jgi:hypothetical protein